MNDRPTRGRPSTGVTPRRVRMTDDLWARLTLAAQVRVWRERGIIAEPGPGSLASASAELSIRAEPSLVADLHLWAHDDGLPEELREEARRLSS